MKYCRSAIILISLIFVPITSSSQDTSSRELLNRPVFKSIANSERSFSSFAVRALGPSRVPGGLVLIDPDNDDAKFMISPSSFELHNVLDALIVADPRYKWLMSNNVVNIAPVYGFPPMLDTVIGQFDHENVTLTEVLTALEETPELRVRAENLNFADIRLNKFDGFVNQSKFSIHCTNNTLREILNEIVRKHGRAVWCYAETTADGKKSLRFWPLYS